jgi:rubrerythrin
MGGNQGDLAVDIYEFALAREKDSETFYRDVAAGCTNPGLQGILLRLADAEVRHQEIVEAMRAKTGAKIATDPFLRDVKGMFTAIRNRNTSLVADAPQLDLYRKAQGFEQESWEMYTKAAAEAKTEEARTVLHRLAAQEKMHLQVLETLCELVSRPLMGRWLENAEWYHLDQY